MRPMRNPVNILRQMARENPAWRNDPRWVKGIRAMRRLLKTFKKERARSREERSANAARRRQGLPVNGAGRRRSSRGRTESVLKLFHGTPAPKAETIIQQGLTPNDNPYGNGVYVGDDPSYSLKNEGTLTAMPLDHLDF